MSVRQSVHVKPNVKVKVKVSKRDWHVASRVCPDREIKPAMFDLELELTVGEWVGKAK